MKQQYADLVTELINRHGKMVYGTVYRILGDCEDAEDAFQEVFLKILDRHQRLLKPGRVRDWGAFLRVTASRCAIDRLRKKSKWTVPEEELIGKFATPMEQNPRDHAVRNQETALLRRAIASLPKRDGWVFVLRNFEDLSYAEIAEQTRLSVNQIGVILHRSVHRLKEMLEPKVVEIAALVENPKNVASGGKGG